MPALSRALSRFGLDWGSTTFKLLKGDRVLLVGFLVLGAIALVPIFRTAFLPLVDLGSSIGAAGLIPWVLAKKSAALYFKINWAPTPYWVAYSIISLSSWLGGPIFAQKLIVAIDVLLLPLAVMRLAHALGRSPRVGLLAFAFVWDVNMYWGWVSFSLGMPIALFAIARLIEVKTTKDALRVIPLSLLVGLSHIHAVAMLGAAGTLLALTRRPFPMGAIRQYIGMSGAGIVMIPWLIQKLVPKGTAKAGPSPMGFDMATLPERIVNLYKTSLDVLPSKAGILATGLVFILWLATCVGLGAMPQRDVSPRRRLSAMLIVTAIAILYFTLPFAIHGPVAHWWTYPRFASYVLIALVLVPAPRLDGAKVLALAPMALAIVHMHGEVSSQFAGFGVRADHYKDIMAAIPEGKTFVPIDNQIHHPAFREATMGQFHGFAAAAKGAMDPHIFDEANNPLLFRHDKMPPIPNWFRISEFSMEAHGQHYDYIIVHGLESDPIPAKGKIPTATAVLVKESGPWRLYRVDKVGGRT